MRYFFILYQKAMEYSRFLAGMRLCWKSNQPIGFANLKKPVVRHIGPTVHKKSATSMQEEIESEGKLQDKKQGIRIVLGKQAYSFLKSGGPFADY